MQQQGWLIPLVLILFLAFAFADCRSPDPFAPVAPPAPAAVAQP